MEKNNRPRKTVTLVLQEERFKVEKQKLIDKSQYFAALLSANYVDYSQTEHVINYDISAILLQDFIDWIHNDKIAFTSAESYDFNEAIDRLLSLLELSVLFAADNLAEDITNKLTERHFMSPNCAINIWLLAQELNINVLRDICFAVCLDRFDELPLLSIYELSRENFLKLIGNINIASTESNLLKIINGWMEHNQDFTIPLDILKNKKAKILHSIISCEHNNREQFIHCWDDNDFFELTSFEYPIDIIKYSCSTGRNLEGVQITGRKYDLYLCGGEYGIGSGKFNKNIWRYSLISKKWFLETVMPIERRHMITVFIKNKLLLVFGVGRFRQKLCTIDIYDIYTGTWTSSNVKTFFTFTSVPDHFIFNDKLIISQYRPDIYIYNPNADIWESHFLCEDSPESTGRNVPILTFETTPCYIDVDKDELVLRTISKTHNMKDCDNVTKTFLLSTNEKWNVFSFFDYNCGRYSFFLTPFLTYEHSESKVLLFTANKKSTLKRLYLHSIPIRNSRKFHSLAVTGFTRKFFNLLHPAHLHTTN